jgi:hypothetical protein
VRSFNPRQNGPARILTVSANPTTRNLTIGQAGDDLVLRLRTPETCTNGLPEVRVADVFKTRAWRDLELRLVSETLTLRVDGRTVFRKTLPDGALHVWDSRFPLSLGNEPTHDRPWLGEISRAEIILDGQTMDCLKPGIVELPWLIPRYQSLANPQSLLRQPKMLMDMFWNFVCFIPLGFFVAAFRGKHGSLVLAILVCSLTSGAVEILQIFLEGRLPSVVDWFWNTLGAAAGGVAARRLFTSAACVMTCTAASVEAGNYVLRAPFRSTHQFGPRLLWAQKNPGQTLVSATKRVRNLSLRADQITCVRASHLAAALSPLREIRLRLATLGHSYLPRILGTPSKERKL